MKKIISIIVLLANIVLLVTSKDKPTAISMIACMAISVDAVIMNTVGYNPKTLHPVWALVFILMLAVNYGLLLGAVFNSSDRIGYGLFTTVAVSNLLIGCYIIPILKNHHTTAAS